MNGDWTISKNVMVFFQDKWRPGVVIRAGRKWAMVQINGRARHSKVPFSALRPLEIVAKPSPAPLQSVDIAPRDEIHLDEFDSYVRLIDGSVVICAIAWAHRERAMEMVAALKAWRKREADKQDKMEVRE